MKINSTEHISILNAEISKLLLKGAIRPVNFTNAAFYSRLFLVPKKGGDLRPVIDLSALNQFVINEHFQMENISCLKQILNQNDFTVKLDLKDAYLTVGVHEQSQHYLRFIWQRQLYQFQALPFGLCTAPRVFTKLLKPVITFLRTHNIRLLIYLDDILIVGSVIKTLKEQTGQVLGLLQSLGFIINFEKSVLSPSPVMEFLGLLVDSRTMIFYLPSHKVTKTIELCSALLQNRTVSLRELAQLLGFLELTRPAVWLAPLHFRHLQYCLIQQLAQNKGSYDGLVCLQLLAMGKLQWWISNIHQVNGSLIHPPSCEMTILSDASKLGWGAVCDLQTTKGSWSSQERSLHINILELKAAFLAIQSFLKHKTNMSIKLRLDNTTAVSYINNKGGTHSPELMALTLELWTWCLSRDIYIQAEHLPGVQNCLADRASRTCIDSSDWKLQPQLIKQFLVDRDTDLFATRLTHQLPYYVSCHPDPKAIAADAFSLNWAALRRYAFPPFNLIPRTLIKVLKDKTTIVLVAPVWQGQTWWPLLLQLAIRQPVRLPSTPQTLKNPVDPTVMHPMFPRLHLAVWLVSSDRAQQSAFRDTLPDSSQPLFANPLTKLTIHHGENGMAGVIDGKLIQFHLSSHSSESSGSFPSLPEDLPLCPLTCLNTYLTATSNLRSPSDQKLFLSFQQPHNEDSRSTITRWLCDVIQVAGIDSSVFRAHSTRAASTSPAAKNNLPLTDILKMGDWSSPSTLQKFYYKPIIDSSYARTVLDKTIS